MFYEVRATLYFLEQDEAEDFYHDCDMAYLKTMNVNPDTPSTECSIAQLIENHHDESPNAPCVLLSSVGYY